MYIYALIVIPIVYTYQKINGTRRLSSFFGGIKHRYNRWRSLNNLVRTEYKNSFMVVWVSASILARATSQSLLQNLNKTVEKKEGNIYEITYMIREKEYRLVTKNQRGPPKIKRVIDEGENDITDFMKLYLGPNNDFHNSKLCPSFFKKDRITFLLSSGELKIFEGNEIIKL